MSSENTNLTLSTARSVFSTVIEFLAGCKEPGLVESGEPILPLQDGEYSIEPEGDGALLESWGGSKLLRRRIKRVLKLRRDKLELAVEQFPRKSGKLTLIDCKSLTGSAAEKTAERAIDLARMRTWCEQLYPLWRAEHLSCGTDLENTLSPRFPRGLLRRGPRGLAVLAAPDAESAADALAFGIIWLQYARSRWPDLDVFSLALFVPREAAHASGLRLRWLNGDLGKFQLFAWDEHGLPEEIRARTWGNADSAVVTRPAFRQENPAAGAVFHEVAVASEAEVVRDVNGTLSLEVNGLPLAVADGELVRAGLKLRPVKELPSSGALLRLARRVGRIRCAGSSETQHMLYRSQPERWLESVIRRNISAIDPTIEPVSLRRQVGGYLGTDHSRTDLLGLDRSGRLVVIEVKVEEDVGLPIQALDYYTRLRLHLQRQEITSSFGSPAGGLSSRAPRLLLVAPALSFHPSNETVLRFFESSIAVRQIGVALEWRKKLRVMFDHGRTESSSGEAGRRRNEWQPISSIKSERPFPP